MTTAERAAAPLLPDMPPRRPDAPGQFAFADQARVRRILEEGGWTGIDLQPLDVECVLPEQVLNVYLTRLGPVGIGASGRRRSHPRARVQSGSRSFRSLRARL